MSTTTAELPDQKESVTEETLDHESGLYRHTKRPEWGVAILAWEEGPHRAYQFEDGRLRKFREGYYSLMQPAEELSRPREAILAGLRKAIETNKGEDRPKALEPVASFDDQVDLFLHLYPEGFEDPDWESDHRESPGRDLKRHREPVLRQAQETLSKGRCEGLLAEDRHAELVEAATEILGNTNLVALKHVKALKRLDEEETRAVAEALANLLHGEEAFSPRFRAWLEVLKKVYGGAPSWRIATALPALVHPEAEVCVRRSAFVRQAAAIAPLARYTRRASPGSYLNFRRVAFAVRTRLEAADLQPRDLLDVHDFIWTTLRNAALEHLGD